MINHLLAHSDPERYDKELNISQREIVIDFPEINNGEFAITHRIFKAGERMRMTNFGGFVRYNKDVVIRSLLQGKKLWMSDTPSEIRDMYDLADRATGNVLVAGLGMGLLATILDAKEEVTHIDIVEIAPNLVDMISPYLNAKSVNIIKADFREWIAENDVKNYDYFILDIWGNLSSDDLNDMLSLWKQISSLADQVIDGGIWGLELAWESMMQQVRGHSCPSEAADCLFELGLEDITEELYGWDDSLYDDEYDWSDEEEDALYSIRINIYGV